MATLSIFQLLQVAKWQYFTLLHHIACQLVACVYESDSHGSGYQVLVVNHHVLIN
jgi:hypothetical protein